MFGTLIKIVLFFISTLGTFELLRNLSREGINRYFLPSLTVAVQVTVLFLAGLLNVLKEATIILYLIGFYGILKSFYQRKSILFLKYYFKLGYGFLFLVMMIAALYVRGKIFVGFDNFSHWALVVRRMLEVNRYPNFEDTLIAFQEYPLGSATYLYYFAKLTGRSESLQMLGQAYMIVASVLPLFAFAKRNRLAAAIVMFFFVNFLFVYNIPIVDLLVDTLLPLIGICGLVFTYQNCREKELKLNLLFSSCYMVQILQTKNSGIFFVILIVIVLLLFAKKNKSYLQNIAASAVPFLSLLLWQKHCQYVFPSAALSKHAMTIENYKTVFGDKTPEDIMTICSSIAFAEDTGADEAGRWGAAADEIDKYWDLARESCENERTLNAVVRSELSWRYVKAMLRLSEFSGTAEERRAEKEKLYNDLVAHGVTRFSEWEMLSEKMIDHEEME